MTDNLIDQLIQPEQSLPLLNKPWEKPLQCLQATYWLIESGHFIVDGTDPLPLLTEYLKTAIGGIEHGYEGSFAEIILASFRRTDIN